MIRRRTIVMRTYSIFLCSASLMPPPFFATTGRYSPPLTWCRCYKCILEHRTAPAVAILRSAGLASPACARFLRNARSIGSEKMPLSRTPPNSAAWSRSAAMPGKLCSSMIDTYVEIFVLGHTRKRCVVRLCWHVVSSTVRTRNP